MRRGRDAPGTGLVRESTRGFMVAMGAEPLLREHDRQGAVLRSIPCEGAVLALALNYAGDVTVGGSSGLRRYSTQSELLWSLSTADLPELGPTDIRSIQVRDNNNMILVNRIPRPGAGISLLEITERKEIVRRFAQERGARCSTPARIAAV